MRPTSILAIICVAGLILLPAIAVSEPTPQQKCQQEYEEGLYGHHVRLNVSDYENVPGSTIPTQQANVSFDRLSDRRWEITRTPGESEQTVFAVLWESGFGHYRLSMTNRTGDRSPNILHAEYKVPPRSGPKIGTIAWIVENESGYLVGKKAAFCGVERGFFGNGYELLRVGDGGDNVSG